MLIPRVAVSNIATARKHVMRMRVDNVGKLLRSCHGCGVGRMVLRRRMMNEMVMRNYEAFCAPLCRYLDVSLRNFVIVSARSLNRWFYPTIIVILATLTRSIKLSSTFGE
jgi:hypothetical protein